MDILYFNESITGLIIAMFLLLGFVVTAFIEPVLIPILTRLKFGQEIREIGPNWHKNKSGTPTMGGITFIICAIILLLAGIMFFYDTRLILILSFIIAYGMIGFLDDFIKVVLRRNLGLTSMQKFLLQLVVAVAYVIIGSSIGAVDSFVYIPFVGEDNFGIYYIPFAIFFIVGVVNSVNLTDGLDGLATSVSGIAFLFFVIVGIYLKNNISAITSSLFLGSCMGFLLFNKYPAKIFMGDTGSLLLGGALAAVAMISKMEVIFVIAGGIYFIETVSVILQVISFKLTGKRIFKMSPIHHHFEMCGWKETKIVSAFSVCTIILCIISLVLILL